MLFQQFNLNKLWIFLQTFQNQQTLQAKNVKKKKVILDLISILQARVELEDYYSRNLEKIGESFRYSNSSLTIHEKDNLKDLFIILRSYFHIQSDQTRTFARQYELEQHFIKEDSWQKDMQFLKQKHSKEIRMNIYKLLMKSINLCKKNSIINRMQSF